MQVNVQITYPATAEAVFAVLTDREFLADVCRATGALSHTVDVEDDGAGVTVTTRRDLPTDEVPDFVKRFVGQTLTVVRVDRWDAPGPDGSRRGTLSLEIAGAPVRLTGTLGLRAEGESAVQDVDGDLKASVPLVGGKIEKAAEPAIRAGLRAEERVARQWLAR